MIPCVNGSAGMRRISMFENAMLQRWRSVLFLPKILFIVFGKFIQPSITEIRGLGTEIPQWGVPRGKTSVRM